MRKQKDSDKIIFKGNAIVETYFGPCDLLGQEHMWADQAA